MKHIKKYKLYENNTIKVLGDEKSDIYDCFLDIIDLGLLNLMKQNYHLMINIIMVYQRLKQMD